MLVKYKIRPLHGADYPPKDRMGGRVGIYRTEDGKEEFLGEYERNYSSLFNTFFPFHLNGKDLALYSADYTTTRIMELPSCRDLGGEEPDSDGFCPADYFIPTYMDQETITRTISPSGEIEEELSRSRITQPMDRALQESSNQGEYTNLNTGEQMRYETTYKPLTPVLYHPFGFVAGCIWGDENTWKIQYMDLSEADKGIFKRDERFGYIELPESGDLKDAIDMYNFGNKSGDETDTEIRINIMQRFDLLTGKRTEF
jgi:hypothetical protein